MIQKPLSNLDILALLAAFVAVGLSVPLSAWVTAQLLQPVHLASIWALLYVPVGLLIVAAFARPSHQH